MTRKINYAHLLRQASTAGTETDTNAGGRQSIVQEIAERDAALHKKLDAIHDWLTETGNKAVALQGAVQESSDRDAALHKKLDAIYDWFTGNDRYNELRYWCNFVQHHVGTDLIPWTEERGGKIIVALIRKEPREDWPRTFVECVQAGSTWREVLDKVENYCKESETYAEHWRNFEKSWGPLWEMAEEGTVGEIDIYGWERYAELKRTAEMSSSDSQESKGAESQAPSQSKGIEVGVSAVECPSAEVGLGDEAKPSAGGKLSAEPKPSAGSELNGGVSLNAEADDSAA